MTLYVRDGEAWSEVNRLWVRDGGTWKQVSALHVRDGETWKSFFAPASGPAAPSGLGATTFDDDRIDLAWTNNDAYTSIEVYRDSSLIDTISGGATSYSDTGLVAGTTYDYFVRGCDGSGCSSNSNTDTASTDIFAPTGLGVTEGDQRNDLSWSNGSPDYQNVEVHRCTGSGCSSHTLHATLAGSATSYADTGLTNGTTYSYKVRGIGNDANSTFAGPVEGTPTDVSSTSNLSAADASTNCGTPQQQLQVDLSWSESGDGSDVTHVEIWRKQGSGGTYSEHDTVSFGVGSYSDTTSLINSQTYFYKVRIQYTDSSHEAFTNEASATPCA